MIEIDGTHGEGGGQLVRTALALSMLTQKAFRVKNIRHGRKQPGLKQQHLHCIHALLGLSESVVEGASLGSEELTFYPRPYTAKNITVDVQTAGSLTLLLQSLLVPAMFAKKAHTIRLVGGTDTTWSMPFDYLNHVLLPHLREYAKNISFSLEKRGYYPKGQGIIEFSVTPNQVYPVENAEQIDLMKLGELVQIKGVSHASHLLQEKQVAERQAQAAEVTLGSFDVPIQIDVQYDQSACPGSGITLWALYSKDETSLPNVLGADALGKRGKPAEDVGTEAAEMLMKEISSGVPVDSHLQDSLIPFIALFGGSMRVGEATEHTKTNIYVCNLFLERKVVFEDGVVFLIPQSI